jgi:molybdopterin-containing oxidoreductase family iron-sulfur binding subunit
MDGEDRPGRARGAPPKRGRLGLPLVGRAGGAEAVTRERGGVGRRRFMAGLTTLTAAAMAQAVATPLVDAAPAEAPAEAPVARLADLPPAREGEGALLRMQRELQKALQKPIEQRRWGMVIDLRKCVGCSACTIACKAENRLPPGVVYRPVLEEEIGEYPNVTRRFVPRPCMQCENPPCVPVCPVGATYKRADGIVEINYEQCIGCRYCMTACPYQARVFDSGDFYTMDSPAPQPYEMLKTYEYGRSYDRTKGESPIGNVRKCHFCLGRLDNGMLPECVTSCIGVATYFGDLNDETSLVAELAASPNVHRLKEELGTKPRVYYLM